MKDFNYKSLHTPVEPLVLRIEPERNSYVLVKMRFDNLAAGLAVGIAVLTISVHCVRAAAANPARSLRYE